MKNAYVIEYLNENEFRKRERSVKKYNMLAYKKLMFTYYPEFREGNFEGQVISTNKKEGITKYELKLPTDSTFAKVYQEIVLHYTVYENQKIVMLNTITPDDILTEGHQKELQTYKGVPISKSHAEKDIFKINFYDNLTHKGNISHEEAVEKAESEYEKYKIIQDKIYISDFDKLLLETEKIKSGENNE